jgi:hypothetical protein
MQLPRTAAEQVHITHQSTRETTQETIPSTKPPEKELPRISEEVENHLFAWTISKNHQYTYSLGGILINCRIGIIAVRIDDGRIFEKVVLRT